MTMYVSILALSLMSCFLGFALLITEGNIDHVRAGRPPNASAALFPNIPFVPFSYVLSVCALDRLSPGTGPSLVFVYALAAICVRAYQLHMAKAKLKELNADSTSSSV